MEKIKKNEKFKIVLGGGLGTTAVYGNVSVAESSGNLLLVTLDSNPDQYSIYHYNDNAQKVLTNAHVFGETGGDPVRHIPGRPITTAGLQQAQQKFNELVTARKEREVKEAEQAQAAAAQQERQAKESARKAGLIQDAKELIVDTKQQLKDAIKGHSNIQDLMFDNDVVNMTNQIVKLEILIKHI